VKLMRRVLATFLLLAFSLSVPAWATTHSGGHTRSYSKSSSGTTHVNGYYRKDGTYVHPYDRSTSGSVPSYRAPSVGSPGRTTHYYGERDSHGRFKRSKGAKDAFMHLHPCPSTGKTSGPCPGYVVDHIVPLKRGGADDPSNMQWQTTSEAKAKDKTE